MSPQQKRTMSITEFRAKFDTEEKCRDTFFKLRYPNGFYCPKCGCNEYYFINTRGRYQCRKCRHQSSITSETVMDKTHLKLSIWLLAMYLFVNDMQGCSANRLSKELQIPYKTAWFVLHRLRSAMNDRDEYILKGVAELDDAFFDAPEKGGKRGRKTKKTKDV